jgi:hypothetical protein
MISNYHKRYWLAELLYYLITQIYNEWCQPKYQAGITKFGVHDKNSLVRDTPWEINGNWTHNPKYEICVCEISGSQSGEY